MKYAFWPQPLNTGKSMKKVIRFVISSMITAIILHILAVQTSAADLQWDTNEDAEYYVVSYGTVSANYDYVSAPVYDTIVPILTTGSRENGDVVVTPGTTWYFAVKAVNSCGNSSVLSDPVSYVVPGVSEPDPLSVSIQSPALAVTITAGESVQFLGSVSGGVSPYTTTWTFGANGPASVSAEDPGEITFPTAGIYDVVFSVKDSTNVSGSSTVRITVESAYVDYQPAAAISSPSAAVSINAGQSVNFAATVTSGNAPFTHHWTFGNSGPASQNVEDPGSVTFPTAGSYTVTYTVTDDDGDTDSDTVLITVKAVYVNELPNAVISSPTSSVTINEGGSVAFEGSVTSGNAPFTHLWTFGANGPSGKSVEDPGSVTFPTAGTYTVTYKVTDNDGETDSASVTVTVNAVYVDVNPTATISKPSTAVTINEGESVVFEGSVTSGNAPFTHTWSFGDSGPSAKNVEDPGSVTFPTAGTYTVTYTVRDNDGDTDSDTAVVTVKAVYINEAPTADITKPSTAVTINAGESVVFEGSVTSGNAPFTHAWTFGTNGPSGRSQEDPGSVTFPNAGTYTVTYTVTDNDGEKASDTVTVTVNTVYVDLTPTATIVNPASSVSISAGGSVMFAGSVTSGNAPFTHAWTFGTNGPSGSSSEDPGNVTFPTAGTYTVTYTVTDNDGDKASDTVTVTVNSIYVNSTPSASISSPSGNVTINPGAAVVFAATVNGGNAPFTHAWSFGTGGPAGSSKEDPGSVTFPSAGTFTVTYTVTDYDGETSKASTTVQVDAPVADPVITDATETVSLTPVLTADLSGTVSEVHWQISTDINFTDIVLNVKVKNSLTLQVPDLILNAGMEYFWRYRNKAPKAAISDWSEAGSFITESPVLADNDGNGIPDTQEAPAGLDLNMDGVADDTQPDTMSCVKTIMGDSIVGLVKSEGVVDIELLESIDYTTITDTANMPDEMPSGMIGFRVVVNNPGDTVNMMVCFSQPIPEGALWYKYDSVNGWQDYSANTTISDDRMMITVTLTDGGLGDADGTVNGVIVDPSGIGVKYAAIAADTSLAEPDATQGCFIGSASHARGVSWAWLLVPALIGAAISGLRRKNA